MNLKILLAACALAASAAHAQTNPLEPRVGKLEREMRAVQRTVFPQGAPLQPEISAPAASTAVGDTASTPLADLNARVDALERSLASVTAASEQQGNRLRLAEDAIKALQGQAAPPASSTIAPQGQEAQPSVPSPPQDADPAATRPDRNAAVAAVEMPVSGDAVEDAYVYGYRLYNAKLYPEAQVKLKEFVAAHPKHKRASYAQNLLGRAYFDEGKPALASVAFYDNYQKMPKGERAAESLYWLGQSLTRLKKPADACKVYDEFEEIYAAGASGQLIARVMQGRAEAKCAA